MNYSLLWRYKKEYDVAPFLKELIILQQERLQHEINNYNK